jgi:biopolymer transport protein TolR
MAFGRLERTEGPRPISDINVTPLVDVMLVLVVILIITAPLMASSLRLDLPRAEAARAGDAPRFVTVGLQAGGQLFFDDKPVTTAELAQALAEAARRGPDTEVQLRADQSVPYGRVVEVMATAQKAGLSRIGFVAEPVR